MTSSEAPARMPEARSEQSTAPSIRDESREYRDVDASAWLRRHIKERRTIAWTGLGTSGSFAQVMAAVSRAEGAISLATSPGSPVTQGADNVVAISKSATALGANPDCVITAVGALPQRHICIDIPDGSRSHWFPLTFTRAACRHLARLLSLGQRRTSRSALPPDSGLDRPKYIIVVETGQLPLRTLVHSAEDKLGPTGFVVCDRREFGHGPHARVIRGSTPSRVVTLRSASTRHEWAELHDWCRANGCAPWDRVIKTEDPAVYLLEAYLTMLDLLESRWAQDGIDWRHRPIPDETDNLRETTRTTSGGDGQ